MSLRNALKTKDFVVTAHVNLADAPDESALVAQAEALGPEIDAVHLTESRAAHMSGLAASALLLRNKFDPVVHMNCRDRNWLALQKDLVGANALGISGVVIVRGGKIPDGDDVAISNVFDVTALDFMAWIQGLKQTDPPVVDPDFLVGANAVAFSPGARWVPDNLTKKCDAGANYIQLQVCFDIDVLRDYMVRIVAAKLTRRARFVAALMPLPDAQSALWVRDSVKGALVPDNVIERLEGATDPRNEGIQICAELMRELAAVPGVSGVDLRSLGMSEDIPATIAASGLR